MIHCTLISNANIIGNMCH